MENEKKAIPVIVEGTWHDKKGNEIPGNLSLAQILKIVINRTAHILRRTLSL